MNTPRYLSARQVEIMLKYYYMKSLVKVAETENMTPAQVKVQLDNGFRIMRRAYTPLFRKGLYFDAPAMLMNMATSAGMTYRYLSERLE